MRDLRHRSFARNRSIPGLENWLILILKRSEPVSVEEQVERLYSMGIGSLQKPLCGPLPLMYSVFERHAIHLQNDSSLREFLSAVPQYFLAERLRINLDLKVASKRLEGKVVMQTPTTEKFFRVLHQCLM